MTVWTNPINYLVGRSASSDADKLQTQILDNIDFAGSHSHSGSAGDGTRFSASQILGSGGQQCAFQYVSLLPFLPTSETSGNNRIPISARISGGYYQIKNTLGASANYKVALGSGTWAIRFVYSVNTNNGIVSACLGGNLIGAIDEYFGSEAVDLFSAASTFILSASGIYTLKLESTGKNALSTGYFGEIQLVELLRSSD